MRSQTAIFDLPTNFSLGTLIVYLPGQTDPFAYLDARGAVRVPKDATLFLNFSQEVCNDLGKIHLVPDHLLANGLNFVERNVEVSNFREVVGKGPKALSITFCKGLRFDQLRQIGVLPSLETLNLNQTPIDSADFSWVQQFPNLKILLLSGTGADDNSLRFIGSLRELKVIHLADCHLSDSSIPILWKLPNLTDVNLGGSQIGDTSFTGLGSCTTIRSIKIPKTRISDRGVETIATEALQNDLHIESLVLRSCRITDRALVRIASLRTLRLIDLTDTEVSKDGAEFMRTALPECRIFIDREKRSKIPQF